MKTIETELGRNGTNLSLFRRVGDVAIFKQTKEGWSQCFYEVIIINKKPDREVFGTKILASEVYPSNEEWGINGWSFSTLEEADRKFRELVKSKTKD